MVVKPSDLTRTVPVNVNVMGDLPHPTGELRRSYTQIDFTMSRERSFIRNQLQHQHHQQHQQQLIRDGGKQRRGGGVGGGQLASRGKPTMELYRPPNTRADQIDQQNGLALNVHAKEFVTMKQGAVQSSRSSVNVPAMTTMNNVAHHHQHHHQQQQQQHGAVAARSSTLLQQSKSSGNILHTLNHTRNGQVLIPVQQSMSTASVLQGPRVHFSDMPVERVTSSSVATAARIPLKSTSFAMFPQDVAVASRTSASVAPHTSHPAPGLKRSKSLGAADVVMGVVKEAPDLGSFPIDVQANIRKALDDPNQLSSRTLMELVRHIMDRAVSSVVYALPAAKLCITIIEKEKKETFLESLLNSCQQWYQERERVLKGTGQAQRYSAFMQFLNEMYCELKRRQLQLKMQQQGASPGLVLLTLLCKCCQDCLRPPQTQGQTDSLFFVLTSVGRDLEQELPSKLNHLVSSVRDTFLSSAVMPQIKKTLLQLIELHAARWQLTASAVVFYTTQQL